MLKKLLVVPVVAISLLTVSCGVEKFESNQTLSSSRDEIVGGTKVSGSKWNSVVALTHRSHGAFCTGTVVNPTTIVTAAHCFCDGQSNRVTMPASDVSVYLGNGKDGGKYGGQYQAKQIVTHPKYSFGTAKPFDIAVVILDEPINMSRYSVTPIPLLTDEALYNKVREGMTSYEVGFGSRVANVNDPRYRATIGSKYEVTQKFFSISDYKVEMESRSNVGTYKGDSGGPSFAKVNGKLYQIGVLSGGWGANDSFYSSVFGAKSFFYPYTRVKYSNVSSIAGTWVYVDVNGKEQVYEISQNGAEISLCIVSPETPCSAQQNTGHYNQSESSFYTTNTVVWDGGSSGMSFNGYVANRAGTKLEVVFRHFMNGALSSETPMTFIKD